MTGRETASHRAEVRNMQETVLGLFHPHPGLQMMTKWETMIIGADEIFPIERRIVSDKPCRSTSIRTSRNVPSVTIDPEHRGKKKGRREEEDQHEDGIAEDEAMLEGCSSTNMNDNADAIDNRKADAVAFQEHKLSGKNNKKM